MPPGFAPHDQRELGVRLVAHDAVHDVRAGFLQPVGQLDVGFLVEARAQLDDDRHVLAGVRRRDQRIDDRRIVAGAVQRLLDREHLRIGGREAHEIHHRREALEGMMQQQIVLADDREQVGVADQALAAVRA